jgi:hypothetical protein
MHERLRKCTPIARDRTLQTSVQTAATIFCQQIQNQVRVAPIVFLFARFRRTNLSGMADSAFDS